VGDVVKLRFMGSKHLGDEYRESGAAPWARGEEREIDALHAQRILEDFGDAFAVVLEVEPDPATVGPVVAAPAAPPVHTSVLRPKRRG
jgi:hypothetical protein